MLTTIGSDPGTSELFSGMKKALLGSCKWSSRVLVSSTFVSGGSRLKDGLLGRIIVLKTKKKKYVGIFDLFTNYNKSVIADPSIIFFL